MVAITAAMLHPTGLAQFAAAYPDRVYDVGIAEQHAVTSASAVYNPAGPDPTTATFKRRARGFWSPEDDCISVKLLGEPLLRR